MLSFERMESIKKDLSPDGPGLFPRQYVQILVYEIERLKEEADWIRTKLNMPLDTPFVSGKGPTLAGAMHVVCSHAHGYETYITAFKCNDQQGEIARLTVENAKLKEDMASAADRILKQSDLLGRRAEKGGGG